MDFFPYSTEIYQFKIPYRIAGNFDGGNFDVFDASSQTVKIKPVKFLS